MMEKRFDATPDAHELWLRENWFLNDAGDHIKFLLDRLDKARRTAWARGWNAALRSAMEYETPEEAAADLLKQEIGPKSSC